MLDLLAFVLGEGDSSRLTQRVKEEAGLVDRIDASSYTPLDPGLFGAEADLDDDQLLQATEAMVREVEILRRETVPEAELEKARANFLAARHWERESVSGMARKLGSYQVMAGDAFFEDGYLERIKNARAEDLLEVAQRWLGPERLLAGAVVPESAETSLDASALRDAVSRGVEAAERLFLPPRRARRAAAPADVAPTGHARGSRQFASRSETACIDYELAGGIRLHVLPRRETPVVALRMAMQGGQLSETADDAGISGFLAGTWLRGTAGHSASDFARRVESLAADIDGFSGRNSLGLTLDATSDRFEPVLDLLVGSGARARLRSRGDRAGAQRHPGGHRTPGGPAGSALLRSLHAPPVWKPSLRTVAAGHHARP